MLVNRLVSYEKAENGWLLHADTADALLVFLTDDIVRIRVNFDRKFDEASGGEFYNNKMPLMRVAEMFLIRCEVQYRQGDADKALATLNDVRVARNLTRLTRQPEAPGRGRQDPLPRSA